MCPFILCHWVLPKKCGYGKVPGPNHGQQICGGSHKRADMSWSAEQAHTLSHNYTGEEPNKTEVRNFQC